MTQRLAVLDIGSHSVLLLVAEGSPGERLWRPVYQELRITHLAEGFTRTGILSAEAVHRTVQAACSLAQRARALGAQKVWAYGTQALRVARNRQDFVDQLRQACGLSVEILSERQEAELAFWAARWSLPEAPDPLVVFDLGGASTEFARGSQEGVEQALSLPLGTLTLTETYLHHDPPLPQEVEVLRSAVRRSLIPVRSLLPVGSLVGTGGTVTSLAALLLHLRAYDAQRVHGTRWPRETLQALARELTRLPEAERARRMAFDPPRARVIVAGAWFVVETLQALGGQELWVSDAGPRYAYLVIKAQTA